MHSALFDSLTASEISRASLDAVRSTASPATGQGFGSLFLDEPDKAKVRAGEAVTRRARAIVLDRTSAASWNVVVDLDEETIVSADQLTEGGAPMLAEEVETATTLKGRPAVHRSPSQARHRRPLPRTARSARYR